MADRAPRGRRLVAAVGGLSVVCNLLQFGWFADHVFVVFAAPGTLLQATWFAGIGRARWREGG